MPSREDEIWGMNAKDHDEFQLIINNNSEGDFVEGIVRGGGGIKLFRFTLNATLASGTADADIIEMDGTDTGIDATVRDPLGIFATLVTVGDAGLCLRQGGLYYVIQAECPA